MKYHELIKSIAGTIDRITRSLSILSCFVLGIMVLLVVANVCGRFLFEQPILGIVELIEMMMVIIGFFAIVYTAIHRGHVRVDLLLSRLSIRTKAILSSIGFLLSAATFAIITYQGTINAIYYAKNLEQTSTVLAVPFAPFKFIMALGCLLLSLRLLVEVFLIFSSNYEEQTKDNIKQ